ncbi:hypothetical protein O181_027515 [Austropuccinia psidii MF-1]|uniref:Uncharacterized protein n=1 Tax=Austropuccinia psidii MF-1 TaxID=1389203 RepID=A0A9Q3CR75_9BASI|nr:hypothetical protein [Austropuccinia psidii MF-1]
MSSNPDSGCYPTQSQQKMTLEQADTLAPGASPPEYARDIGLIIDWSISMIKQEHVLRGELGDDRNKHICCAILLSSLPDFIQDSVITLRPCSAIYGWLKRNYFIITQSTQCASFNKLFSIEINNDKAPSSLVMRLNEALTEFKNQGGVFKDDYVLGQLLQCAIIKRPAIYQSVMDKLDGDMPYGKMISFPSCILTLESCFQRPEAIEHLPGFNSLSLEPPSTNPHPTDATSHSALRTVWNSFWCGIG